VTEQTLHDRSDQRTFQCSFLGKFEYRTDVSPDVWTAGEGKGAVKYLPSAKVEPQAANPKKFTAQDVAFDASDAKHDA
jgi:hypothetical protein